MSHHMSLQKLLSVFPDAPYVYLKITNYEAALQRFLETNETENPDFSYPEWLSLTHLKERKNQLQAHLDAVEVEAPVGEVDIIRSFLNRRIQETEMLEAFFHAKYAKNPDTKIDNIRILRELNEDLYDVPTEEIFAGIVQKILVHPRTLKDPEALRLVEEIKGFIPHAVMQLRPLFRPSPETFRHYREFTNDIFADLLAFIDELPEGPYHSEGLVEIFQTALEKISATDEKWQAVTLIGLPHVRVSHRTKQVCVGTLIKIDNKSKLRQLLLHELGLHVTRSIGESLEQTVRRRLETESFAEGEEGLAVALEQLSLSRFTHKRTFRYLIAGLALGLDGEKRDFTEVFRVVWRVVQLQTGVDELSAKKRAFKECARIFRGGLPNERGVIYHKDICYLAGNIKVWKMLEAKLLTKDEFKRLLAPGVIS